MSDVIVLGAGMVGVSTALALQARGRQVTLLDRSAPGRETSYGNAGFIQVEAVEPYAMPRSLRDLMRIALRQGNDVFWQPAALPGHFTSLRLYHHFSEPARHRAISRIYCQLTPRATADHAPLIAAAGADSLIRRDGFLQAYRRADQFDAAADEAARLQRDYGVASTVLDGAALAAAEPNLRRRMAGAIHWTDPWTCADPGALVAAYAALFIARGGRVGIGDAMSLRQTGSAYSVLATMAPASSPDHGSASKAAGNGGGERIEAAEVVIALGPWSGLLCERLGLSVPMFAKRGYHQHFSNVAGPRTPFVDVEASAALAPMRAGLRITTGAEIATRDAAPQRRQLDRAARAARELFDIGEPIEATPWRGSRPCMPEMLPIVGPMPEWPGLWANFGHGHQGFTLGPTTARILADQITGQGPGIPELAPSIRIGKGRARLKSMFG